MQEDGSVAVSSDFAEDVIVDSLNELKKNRLLSDGYSASDILDELQYNRILKDSQGSTKFVHQSFQEYYAAKELSRKLISDKNKCINIITKEQGF